MRCDCATAPLCEHYGGVSDHDEAQAWVDREVSENWPADEPDAVEVKVPLGVLRGLASQ